MSVTTKWEMDRFLAMVKAPGGGQVYESLSDMIEQMVSDQVEWMVISDLLEELRRDGAFRKPLVVIDGELTNGTHRLCALVVAKSPWVFVTDELDGPRDITRVSFRVRAAGEIGWDEFSDMALWAGRSGPGPRGWIESDGGSGTGSDDGGLIVEYEYTSDRGVVEAALANILGRYSELGIEASINAIEPTQRCEQ